MKKNTFYNVRLTFVNPILGCQPAADVADRYIAERNGMRLPEDEEELLTDALDKGTTTFHKLPDGTPAFLNYQIKGFLKKSAAVFNGKVTGEVRP